MLLLTFFFWIMIEGCDPAYNGMSLIRNQTPYSLAVLFRMDTSIGRSLPGIMDATILIPPDTVIRFTYFGGLGNAKYFDCCVCEFDSIFISLVDTGKVITKNIADDANWKVFNPNKNFGGKAIECEFVLKPSDIQ